MNDYPSPNGPPPKCSRIDENDENTDEKYFSSKNLDILVGYRLVYGFVRKTKGA